MSQPTPTPRDLRQRAAQIRELAKLTREGAQYADGPAYRNDLARADNMELEASKLDRQAFEMERA